VTATPLAGTHHHSGVANNNLGALHNNLGALHHGHHNGNGNGHHHHHGGNFFNPYFPFFGFFPFGLYGYGYPYYGYGYGYPYYGYGYGLGGYGYGSYGYNPNAYYATYAATQPAAPASSTAADDARIFAQKGENDFKAGDYKGAAYAWKHAVTDDPQNGVLLMMLGQALFAAGQYDEAAGATQAAMQVLPEDKWNVVVKNFRELYGKAADYTTQLRALEKEVKTNGDNPATRFLLGFHYGYLGYPGHAVKQLDKTLKLAPGDQMAKKLREIMAGPDSDEQQPGDAKQPDDKSAKEADAPEKSAESKEAVDT
jgi:tetratricopeptide (TPR) repeat protein